jgi:hypothetical protein
MQAVLSNISTVNIKDILLMNIATFDIPYTVPGWCGVVIKAQPSALCEHNAAVL